MQGLTSVNIRQRLLQLYQRLLVDICGDRLVAQALQSKPLKSEKIVLLASGKAAASMARGAVQVLGNRIVDARVITKEGHCRGLEEETGIRCLQAGHPLPDARSLAAGQELLEWLPGLPTGVTLLVLTSGGTSALVEVLPLTTSLETLVRLNQWLLGSGLDIHAMNRIRRSVSCIKGGGLLAYVPPMVLVEHLILSDVPGDNLAIIGSGLFVAMETECNADTQTGSEVLPDWLRVMQQAARGCRAWQAKNLFSHQVNHQIIASNRLACQRLRELAMEMGLDEVHLHRQPLAGAAWLQGRTIAHYLRKQAPTGLHIWGGETTVVLPSRPGRGGRNQHLALAAAQELAGTEHISLLTVATDGSDGPTDDAGAIVDGGTLRRGQAEGLDAGFALQQADSGHFLEASGDLVSSGVTGTNLMDIVLAFKEV
ncbi:D-glycerate 2-kinase [hydrothermal vent metagenome]|uniref:D-glycerate 2-kinase n=1 Tax=hydrothermal vent metagenome TaxID=652676 RepID=A0A3B1BAX6_9ZZZZ